MAQQANGTTTTASTVTLEQLAAELATLRAQNATLQAQVASKQAGTYNVTCKVSTKGALSVYGLQRWPITLYRRQWEALLAQQETVKQFMAAHQAELVSRYEQANG